MKRLYTIKWPPLAFVQLLLAFLCLFSGCRFPKKKVNKSSAALTALPTTFPPCFSINGSLDYGSLQHTFHCRVVCCVAYDRHIHFIVKGPLGLELLRGVINKKGVTVLDRFHRVVHQWDYKRIKQHFSFHCNYLLIQSLLLGTVCNTIEKGRWVIPAALRSYLSYTYDSLTGKVSAVQLMDQKQGNCLRFVYQRKVVAPMAGLSGIKIYFAWTTDKAQLYQGMVTLDKLRFKALKMPNIRLTILAYYLRK